MDTHELEKQIDSWSTHGSRHVAGHVCPTPRKCAAGRLFGAVSPDGRRLGDFRAAFREAEITRRRVAPDTVGNAAGSRWGTKGTTRDCLPPLGQGSGHPTTPRWCSYIRNVRMTDDQRRQIISRLNGRDQVDAFEAAKAIWQDSDKRLERLLILTLKDGRRPFHRAAAPYATQIVTTPRTIRALESVVKHKFERPRVRREPAEALAHCHRRKSHDVLFAGLVDSSRDVRFWCAFALGQMAERTAIPALRASCRQ